MANQSLEIRLHGRGGQGGVTCAKILATVYSRLGKSVQTFGDYSGERSGAPVRAYTRVSDGPITNRNKVYEPDHLLVLDDNLLGETTVAGLAEGGALVVNTAKCEDDLAGDLGAWQLATVDATAIARRHGIGTRSVVIVNTTIAGAFCRVLGIDLAVLEETYEGLGFSSNFAAAKEAYEAVCVREDWESRGATADISVAALPEVGELVEHTHSPPTGLLTGSWSSQRPAYMEKLAPCSAWCPAGNDVVGFVRAAATEGEEAAAHILGRTTPLSATCGRVCPAPCMEGCNRAEYDGSVNIRGLERIVADNFPVARANRAPAADARSVAIIGGGPAGLAAAYELARAGQRATIFEHEAELGGVLRTGIPTYRLPREVLDQEVNGILALGVQARCGESVDAEQLGALAEEYDGVLLATGLQRLRGLDIPGAELGGIGQGIEFLHGVNLESAAGPLELSGHVVVLGGGNTAMDCARSALRCGAERVTVAYRRTRDAMPAIAEEIVEADHEGVVFLTQRQPVAFHPSVQDGARLGSLELAEVEMGEPDESGRRSPVVTDRTERLACEHVLLALGQSADLSCLPAGWQLEDDGRIDTGASAPKAAVRAAGDVTTWEGTVTHAIGSGRRAAGLLMVAAGIDVEVFERPDRARAVPATAIRFDHFEKREPALDRAADAAARVTDLREANLGLEDSAEALRCFSCGKCTECDTCLVYCPEGIISRHTENGRQRGYAVDESFCKGCGICVEECPRESMEMIEL
ncbi:MAG: 2-oxoacid:acceptor oxidoreductase family protein [Planctomycetota bacterium]|jgi:2-oxoacid:acceptor oxidoreductase gamma subunit (pyruvate/2-ketoisovalerate family)|nr:hypothetical protein [Planctomycetota bacterium]MDP6838089.1 2-oxoacid:acceptor oxidoreductase family protein [Planctomycetota bacterium]MDP6955239.1 2-oxoacid:acceptor oxidoreductase family protein [Planctomycetota bacterium]